MMEHLHTDLSPRGRAGSLGSASGRGASAGTIGATVGYGAESNKKLSNIGLFSNWCVLRCSQS